MKKRILPFALALVLALGLALPSEAASAFDDVASSHWAYPYITEANSDGVMQGTGTRRFSPDQELTVAEFMRYWSALSILMTLPRVLRRRTPGIFGLSK